MGSGSLPQKPCWRPSSVLAILHGFGHMTSQVSCDASEVADFICQFALAILFTSLLDALLGISK